MRHFLPFYEALVFFVQGTKVSSTVGMLLADLTFDILRMDPLTNTFVNSLDTRMHSQLLFLIKSSIQIVKYLYLVEDHNRGNIHQFLISLLHDTFTETKNPFRALIVDTMFYADDSQQQYRVTNGTYCLLTLIQAVVQAPNQRVKTAANSTNKLLEPEEMLSESYRVISTIILEIFQRFNNKETASEYYQTMSGLLQEMTVALQSPIWPSASIFVEKSVFAFLLQLKKLLGEDAGNMEGSSSSAKRDLAQINLTLDALSLISERISTLTREIISQKQENMSALLSSSTKTIEKGQQVSDFVIQSLQLKSTEVQPLWQAFLQKEEQRGSGSYWNESLESPQRQGSLSSLSSPKTKKSKEKEKSAELPFMKQLDAFMEVISDTVDLLEDNISSFENTATISNLLNDGGINLTFDLLGNLSESQDLSLLLSSVSPLDLKYSRLVRYLVEHNGSPFFYLSGLSAPGQVTRETKRESDESLRDAFLFLVSFWAQQNKGKTDSSQPASPNKNARNTSNQDVSSSSKALLELAAILTERPTPGSSQKPQLPSFLLEVKAQGRKLVQDICKSVVEERTLHSLLSKILDCFLFMVGDSSPLIRARSVKSLSRLLQTNFSLLDEKENLDRVIVSILYDRSIAVREEGVKLIGPIISSAYPKHCDTLLEELKPLLLDEGISVRKSSIVIIRDILQNQPIHPQYIDLCSRLLERLAYPKEEETIKEIICSIFQQIWFSPPSSSAVLAMRKIFLSASTSSAGSAAVVSNESKSMDELDHRGSSSDVVENPYYQLGLLSRALSRGKEISKQATLKDFTDFHFEFTALQLIEIALLESSHSWILVLLQELLHGKAGGSETSSAAKARREAAYQHCYKIVSFMVELLLLIEENKHQAVRNFLTVRKFSPQEYKASIISTIALFCEAHPPFVSKHLLTFLPYLKGDSNLSRELNMVVSGHIIRILESTALLEKSNLSLASPEGIIQDLANIAFTHSGKNISSAISCIATLISCVTMDALPFFRLIERCYQRLLEVARTVTDVNQPLHPEQSGRLQRFMVMFGYICEHSRKCKALLMKLPTSFFASQNDPDSNPQLKKLLILETEKVASQSFVSIVSIDPRTFHGVCYAAVLFGLSLMREMQVQLRSIQALCGIFAGYPRIMLHAKETQLIQRILSAEFSELIHERFLIGLKDMMVSEEKLLEKKATLKQMKEVGVELISQSNRDTVLGGPVDHDSDATIAGFVLQQYLKILTNFLEMKSTSLRFATLQLLATLLRQGMICPLDVLALAIMLLGDENEEIRQESFILLQIQDERHPNFLDSRLLEGIEKTHDFQFHTFHHLAPLLPKQRQTDTAHSIFSNLYLSCILPNKRRKINFLYGLLRKALTLLVGENPFLSLQNKAAEIPAGESVSVSVPGQEPLASPAKGSSLHVVSPQKSTPVTKRTHATPSRSATAAVVVQEISLKNVQSELSLSLLRFSKVQYFATTLSSLPFGSIDEVLHVIHWVGRTVPTHCVRVLKNQETLLLSAFPAAMHGADPLEAEIRLDEEKALALARDPPGDLPQQLYELLVYALQIRAEEVLLRLKAYFKTVYNLSDEKCQLFDPNESGSSSSSSSSERLNNDRYFDFSLAPKDTPTIESLLDLGSLPALLSLFARHTHPATAASGGRKKKGEATTASTSQEAEQLFLAVLRACAADFNRVHHIVHSEGDDFKLEAQLSLAAANKRRKSTKAATADGEAPASAKKKSRAASSSAKKPAPKGKGKRKRGEDEDDEEDWDEEMLLDEEEELGEGEAASRKKSKTAASTASSYQSKARSVKQNAKYLFEEDEDPVAH